MTISDAKDLTILVIDDEPFVRATISEILATIGVTMLLEADSARAAMTQILAVRPHLVLCDIHMPGEDGLAFVRRLRNAPDANVSGIPVVMLTSDSTEGAVLKAKDLKVEGYLVKPVSVTALKRAMERALKVPLA